MAKQPHKQAYGSVYVIANTEGAIRWQTARSNPGDCWDAFNSDWKWLTPKNRLAAISKTKRGGWRCAKIWAQELYR